MQDWVRTGVPPVQPDGEEVATVRVCWAVEGQVLGVHALYVNEEQVAGVGGVYVQDWVRTGVPPVQPDGEEVATVRVCWPVEGQVLGVHALYVNEEQVAGGGGTPSPDGRFSGWNVPEDRFESGPAKTTPPVSRFVMVSVPSDTEKVTSRSIARRPLESPALSVAGFETR